MPSRLIDQITFLKNSKLKELCPNGLTRLYKTSVTRVVLESKTGKRKTEIVIKYLKEKKLSRQE